MGEHNENTKNFKAVITSTFGRLVQSTNSPYGNKMLGYPRTKIKENDKRMIIETRYKCDMTVIIMRNNSGFFFNDCIIQVRKKQTVRMETWWVV